MEKHYREFVHKEYRHRVGANIRYDFRLWDKETQQSKSEYGHKSGQIEYQYPAVSTALISDENVQFQCKKTSGGNE